MFSLYSKGCEYAIRALVRMAGGSPEEKFRAADICRMAEIPEAYARKTFQALVAKGFLRAVSGPKGGYSLIRDPSQTTVLDVIKAVDGERSFGKCVLGLPACGEHNPCSLHLVWSGLKAEMINALAHKTLKHLAASGRRQKRGKCSR